MSAIDKLKGDSRVINFDTTTPDAVPVAPKRTVQRGSTMDINMVNGEDSLAVEAPTNLSGLASRGKHQVVLPQSPAKRSVANITDIGDPEPLDENIHESPEKDLLDIDNPNSMFRQYVENKDKEASEWIAEKEEERRVLDEETTFGITEDDYEEDFEDSDSDEEYTLGTGNENLDNRMVGSYKMSNIETEDLSGLLNPEDYEEEYEEIVEEEIVEETVSDNVEENAAVMFTEEDNFEAVDNSVIKDNNIIEEDEEEVQDTESEDVLKHLQKLATEKLKPVSKQLNISSFTILKKPVANTTSMIKDSTSRVAKWVLPTQESVVLMKEFSGSELEKMREYSENSRSLDALNRRFNMIYSHIMSAKPASFDVWLKTTPFDDVDAYFFAIYVACFKGSNYLPADCINPSCKETFLSDDIDIMRMVEFDNDAAKKKFVDLYQSEANVAGKGIYCTEVVPLNNRIAVSFRQPSIYNVFEIASLDDKTRAEYSAIIDYIPYIDTVYAIDMQNQTLTPIGYKMFADNNQRTVRSKIQKYNSLFATLSVDEFALIKSYVKAIAEKDTGIHYVYPEIECPKCHNTTEKQRTTAEELVFTRYQLGTLVNTSLN